MQYVFVCGGNVVHISVVSHVLDIAMRQGGLWLFFLILCLMGRKGICVTLHSVCVATGSLDHGLEAGVTDNRLFTSYFFSPRVYFLALGQTAQVFQSKEHARIVSPPPRSWIPSPVSCQTAESLGAHLFRELTCSAVKSGSAATHDTMMECMSICSRSSSSSERSRDELSSF